jgi:hypothetical protein
MLDAMTSTLRILIVTALLPAALAAAATRPAHAGICLPNSTRYTKCVDGKTADCTRSRNIKCKTREKCVQTGQACDLPPLMR